LDRATSARLAKLASRPVDTSRLERRLETAMREVAVEGGVSAPSPAARMAWRRWWRPVTSAAAAILIITAIGWLALDVGTSPAMAAPAALAQIHFDVAKGLAPHLEVSSVDEANQLLADQSNGVVPIPELPGTLKSCCLHPLAGTTLTCALIERDGQLITVAIADGATIRSPHGKTITRGDRQFIAHTANGINMVMAFKGDRWLCVMGDTSTEQLLDVAARITY
jgi:hypothetical protein